MKIILRRRGLGMTSCREIANQTKNDVVAVRNDQGIPTNLDLCIRWGCTSVLNTENVLNTARAIHQVNDKTGFRRVLETSNEGLAPKTWFSIQDWQRDAESYPNVIIRPHRHAQGRNLLFVNKDNSIHIRKLHRFARKHPNYYIGEFINKVAEFRVFVVSGKAVAVAEKTPENPEAIAWNVAKGGRFDNVNWDNWNLKAVDYAIKAFNMTDLDFGGVDVMVDKDNNAFILEINSAPSLTSPYRQQCMAKAFDYIIDNGKDKLSVIQKSKNYRDFIHPAILKK